MDNLTPMTVEGVRLSYDIWTRISQGNDDIQSDLQLLARFNNYVAEVANVSKTLSSSVRDTIDAGSEFLKVLRDLRSG